MYVSSVVLVFVHFGLYEVLAFTSTGFGVYVYENKFFKYEGEWKSGTKHGHGKLSMADGSYYEGEFADGEIEGHGYRYFSLNGNSYSGQFHMGELHGHGVMKYKDCSTYEGEWYRNVRQGYGVYKCQDNSVYQGYLHNHHRHGEGTQIYSNGDRYDGDWIMDKRQGHGELRERDGTTYDGQWQNNVYNGQGTMTHASGMFYEGLWVNGRPSILSTHLLIKASSPLEVMQGVPFTLEIVCLDGDGKLVEDMGREIQITAGFKYSSPVREETAGSDEPASTGLFDMIEDIEEKPVETPFGYSIIPYPITDQFPYKDNDEVLQSTTGSRNNTTSSEPIIEDTLAPLKESEKEEESKDVDTTEQLAEAAEGTEGTVTDEAQTTSDLQEQAGGDEQTAGATISIDEVPLPPPVSNRKCEQGVVTFTNLVLAAAPPMYRPFNQLDDAEKKPPKSKASKKGSDDEASRPTTRAKSREKSSLGDDRFARGASSRLKSAKSEKSSTKSGRKSVVSGKAGKKSKPAELLQIEVEQDVVVESESEEEEDDTSPELANFASPGEYVIMAQDVTNPPFAGMPLEPAFIVVKVNVPKKPKKLKKDTRPKWDTSKHIAASMARGYSDLATEEELNLPAGS